MRSKNVLVAVGSIGAVFIFALSCAQVAAQEVQPTKQFAQELSQAGLVFDVAVFRDFTLARVLPNPDFDYSFAVRHRTLPLEIRFSTRNPHIKVNDGGDAYVDASIMNMARKESSGPAMVGPKPFDKHAVREGFNADWGATSRISPAPTFAKYENGLVTVIYQEKRQSLGYMIYLYNGDLSGDMEKAVGQVFYAMRFR